MSRFIKIFFLTILSVVLGYSCGQKRGNKNPDPPIDMADFDPQADIRKGDIHLISYGLTLSFPGQDSLTKLYGFYYQQRGCSLSDTEAKLTEIYNKQIIEHLSKRNGKDWFKKLLIIDSTLQENYSKANGL